MNKKLKKDIVQWDVKSWNKALTFWENQVNWEDVSTCLELGTGPGGLTLWLAKKEKEVVCSDISKPEVSTQELHSKYQDAKSFISYEEIDATSIPYHNHFDLIVFKSIMGGVGWNNNKKRQQKAFDEIYKALKPGGVLLFSENLTGSKFHQYMRKTFISWAKSWRYITLEEQQLFLKKFSTHKMRTTGVLALLGRNEMQRNFLASVDQLGLNKMVPEHWRYIVYGIAVK